LFEGKYFIPVSMQKNIIAGFASADKDWLLACEEVSEI